MVHAEQICVVRGSSVGVRRQVLLAAVVRQGVLDRVLVVAEAERQREVRRGRAVDGVLLHDEITFRVRVLRTFPIITHHTSYV